MCTTYGLQEIEEAELRGFTAGLFKTFVDNCFQRLLGIAGSFKSDRVWAIYKHRKILEEVEYEFTSERGSWNQLHVVEVFRRKGRTGLSDKSAECKEREMQ